MFSAGDIPAERPPGLRLTSIDAAWWRLDARSPGQWTWTGYDTQHGRFDPHGGRVRYAARTERGAFRERFAERRRRIREEDAEVRVVRLAGRVRVLDLRSESALDALRLDAEISTARSPRVWEASAALAARVQQWYGERCHGVVYTSRTTPQTSVNLAFHRWAPLRTEDIGSLESRVALLAELIADDGFRVDLPGWI